METIEQNQTPIEINEQKVGKSSPSHLVMLFLAILGVVVLSILGTYYYLLPQLQQRIYVAPTIPYSTPTPSLKDSAKTTTYTGILQKESASIYMQGTHELIMDGTIALLLKSEAIDLKLYEGKKVTVEGPLEHTVEGQNMYIMTVERITVNDQSQTTNILDWKTFSSSRCNISVKYPAGFTAEDTKLVDGTNNPNYNYGCISITSPDFNSGLDSYSGLLISISRTTIGTTIASKTINSITDYINLQNETPPVINQSKKTYANGLWDYYEINGQFLFANLAIQKGKYIYHVSWAKDHVGSYADKIDSIVNSLQM